MADEFETKKRQILTPIYFEAGAALFDCQSFEYAIAYLLYLFSRRGFVDLDPKRCTAILDDDEKKTAGQLIQILRKSVRLSEGLEEGLVKALEARNRLVHRYLIDNVERLADLREHDALVREIRALRTTVRSSEKQLAPFIKHLAQELDGVDVDAVSELAKRKFTLETREH